MKPWVTLSKVFLLETGRYWSYFRRHDWIFIQNTEYIPSVCIEEPSIQKQQL